MSLMGFQTQRKFSPWESYRCPAWGLLPWLQMTGSAEDPAMVVGSDKRHKAAKV